LKVTKVGQTAKLKKCLWFACTFEEITMNQDNLYKKYNYKLVFKCDVATRHYVIRECQKLNDEKSNENNKDRKIGQVTPKIIFKKEIQK